MHKSDNFEIGLGAHRVAFRYYWEALAFVRANEREGDSSAVINFPKWALGTMGEVTTPGIGHSLCRKILAACYIDSVVVKDLANATFRALVDCQRKLVECGDFFDDIRVYEGLTDKGPQLTVDFTTRLLSDDVKVVVKPTDIGYTSTVSHLPTPEEASRRRRTVPDFRVAKELLNWPAR